MTNWNKGKGRGLQWIRDHISYAGDGCLTWPMFRDTNGYGRVGHYGKITWAHRLMCILAHGEPPTPKHQAAHSCGNGHLGCVNPKHISWKTRSENGLDCQTHGRVGRSVYGSLGKLRPVDIDQIRALLGRTTKTAIAKQFGVHERTIRRVEIGEAHASERKHAYLPQDDEIIRDGYARNVPIGDIAGKLGRTVGGIYSRACRLGLTRENDSSLWGG